MVARVLLWAILIGAALAALVVTFRIAVRVFFIIALVLGAAWVWNRLNRN